MIELKMFYIWSGELKTRKSPAFLDHAGLLFKVQS
jgi:hypothetical protein